MAMSPTMGSPLESPDTDTQPGVARPSQLLATSPGSSPDDDNPEPNRQMTQVISRVRQMEDQIEQLAASYPGAAPDLRKVKDTLRKALQKIVATGGGPGQETPSPRMLG